MLVDFEAKIGALFTPCGRARERRLKEIIARRAELFVCQHGLNGALRHLEYKLSRVNSAGADGHNDLRWYLLARIYESLKLQRDANIKAGRELPHQMMDAYNK